MERLMINPLCLKCLLDKTVTDYPPDTPKDVKRTYMKEVMKILGEADPHDTAPFLHFKIYRLQEKLLGKVPRDFTDIKYYFNELMMNKVEMMRQALSEAEDPLYRALQFAMTGNYIDFAAMANVDEHKLDELIADSVHEELDRTEYTNMKTDLAKAKKIVYLTDNCGEIVFDMVLMEELQKLYPKLEVVALVRGEPIANDATMIDACQIGLDKAVRTMGNGNGFGGTVIEWLSSDALHEIKSADLIIAKGQGNFETLQSCGLNVYYLFMCKCINFTQRFGVKLFDGILTNELRLRLE